MKIKENIIIEFNDCVLNMIQNGFRFSVIHNPNDKKLQIVSAVEPDKIKHKFPEFNIFLSGRSDKMVERIFFYD